MAESLIALLKEENKKINSMRFKLGRWYYIIYIITFIPGMGLIFYTSPKEDYYWIFVCIGIILVILSMIFIFYFSKKINKKVTDRLGGTSEKKYIKQLIKDYLINDDYYHKELIENLITTFESKYKDKINVALIITLIIFVVSPVWGLLLNIAYEKTHNISFILILTVVMIISIFVVRSLVMAFHSYRYFLDIYMCSQLKEFYTEYLHEEVKKRNAK
ncbi:hypothetical protein [Listeria seeligeri]|uniref:hypothetical protein n=1 Tax=Listeria seeligeri TaxID=1640 RepID=UPI0022EB60FA|nr:hypothetical protein [Listeria seeligeri]